MKLRCTHNSIRIRIRKSELEQLAKHAQLSEEVLFPDGNLLRYILAFRQGEEQFNARFTSGEVYIQLPAQTAISWTQNDTVGIETQLELANGQSLQLLIEKDFPCKDRVDEDKTDFFGKLASQEDGLC